MCKRARVHVCCVCVTWTSRFETFCQFRHGYCPNGRTLRYYICECDLICYVTFVYVIAVSIRLQIQRLHSCTIDCAPAILDIVSHIVNIARYYVPRL